MRTLSLPTDPSVVGKVVSWIGTVTITRRNVKKPIVVRRAAQLVLGDTLVIAASSSAKVVCFSPLRVNDFAAGDHPDICKPGEEVTDDFINNYNRGRLEISPGPGGGHFEPRANEYPKILAVIRNARPEYLGSTISLNKVFPNDPLLTNDERSKIIGRIDEMPNMSDDEKRLLRADALAMNGLYEPAIDELKRVVNAADEPFVQVTLGDLYLAANLGGDAKRAYSSAIRASVAANDLFSEALAQHAFGMVLRFEGGKVSEASSALARAILLYQGLGETSAAVSLKAELESLQNSPRSAPKRSIKKRLRRRTFAGCVTKIASRL
jgi:tetratricopeptide (TPR) repeat protein